MTLVIVYVGAVAVLFLFVVMMLDVNFAELRQGFLKYLPLGLGVTLILCVQLGLVFYFTLSGAQDLGETIVSSRIQALDVSALSPNFPPGSDTNTQEIGKILYTRFVYPFQMSGLVLLVAMIGAIVLTLRQRAGVRRQNISEQVSRSKQDSIEIVKVQSGQGVS